MSDYPTSATYTLEDLPTWNRPGPSLAVLGYPVRHSISPQMHNAALAQLAAAEDTFAKWTYYRFEVPAENLIDALPLFHEKGFIGLNLTVPHKEIALPALESISPQAQEIGAVNTLKRGESGYQGFNTDGHGLSSGIRNELECAIEGSDIVLLGAGGAGRAAALQCLYENCRSLLIVNRNQERLARLLEDLQPVARRCSTSITSCSPSDKQLEIPENALIINATSLGLKAGDPLPIPAERLPPSSRLFDMIYNPSTTPLMKAAAARGAKTANGLSMLVNQGAKALELWTERSVPIHAMQQAAAAAMQNH